MADQKTVFDLSREAVAQQDGVDQHEAVGKPDQKADPQERIEEILGMLESNQVNIEMKMPHWAMSYTDDDVKKRVNYVSLKLYTLRARLRREKQMVEEAFNFIEEGSLDGEAKSMKDKATRWMLLSGLSSFVDGLWCAKDEIALQGAHPNLSHYKV